jgi:hypothetical protein
MITRPSLDVLREDAVRADQDVDRALLDAPNDLLLLLAGDRAREPLDLDREVGQALAEDLQVLVGEHRGGDEQRHLPAGAGHAEGCAHGDLGLAEADVAAQQPVHRTLARKVGQDVLVGLGLVLCVGVGEGVDQVAHELEVEVPGGALVQLALGLDLDQIGGQVEQRAFDLLAPPAERLPADLVARRRRTARADVALHQVDARRRHEQAHVVGEQEVQVLLLAVAAPHALEPLEQRQPVHRVHDEVARLQLEERLQRARLVDLFLVREAAHAHHAGQLAVVDDHLRGERQAEALGHRADAHVDALQAAGVREHGAEAVRLGIRLAQHDDLRAGLDQLAQQLRRLLDPARQPLHRARVHIERARRQALQREPPSRVQRLLQLAQRALVRARLDAEPARAILDAQRLDLDEHGAARQQLRRLDAVALFDRPRVGGQRQRGLLERLHARLQVRVEAAQRLDLLVEQLDAQRQVGREREHVEDVPAHADLARLLDQRLPLVARVDQPLEQVLHVERLPDPQHEQAARELFRIRHGLQ